MPDSGWGRDMGLPRNMCLSIGMVCSFKPGASRYSNQILSPDGGCLVRLSNISGCARLFWVFPFLMLCILRW